MHPTAVINVVGLTPAMLGERTPNISRLAASGGQHALRTVTPAVTCSVQSTFLTGLAPSGHGIVANGWYFRDLAQVWLWRQSNHLVGGEKVWEAARRRDLGFHCAKMFWWYNMYSGADYSVTPRPAYPADGRKIFDVYSEPMELGPRIKAEIGAFPFFSFWGPKAGLPSSQWIADASALVFDWETPHLTLIYLPHLDYNLQRLGPDDPALDQDIRDVDRICGQLIDRFQAKGARVIVLSEYGITPVDGVVHINRVLREAGLIEVRPELGLEMLDAGACTAFAVSDHQVAHVYIRDPQRVAGVKALLEAVPGIEAVLDGDGKREAGLDHPRAGELVAISAPDKWFSYYYWLDDALAPDFARTVDIHRKPGFDPVELFIDPKIVFPALKVGGKLLRKMLGFRYLMDVIPLDPSLVKGSHGRITGDPAHGPLFITSEKNLVRTETVAATEVKQLMLDHLFQD